MLRFRLPGRFKLIGMMALSLLIFMTGGAFADELTQVSNVTPDIMDKFTNLGLAVLVAHMWSKDAQAKNAFINDLFQTKNAFINTLFEEHKEEKNKLLDTIRNLKS